VVLIGTRDNDGAGRRPLPSAVLLALRSPQKNFGPAAVEALACGVPVLVSPHVNLADDVQAVGAGWVVPLGPVVLPRLGQH
jgi:glycosyltransferase involved in cell wall biosynthesis